MLLNKETKEKYGYNIFDLTECSSKIVIIECDYCKIIYERKLVRINRGCSKLNKKHSCGAQVCNMKKRDETNINKYGVASVMCVKSIHNKHTKSIQKKYGVDNISQCSEIVEKKRNTYRKKNEGKLILEWANDLNKCSSTMGQMIKKYGLEIAKSIKKNKSGLETKIEKFLKDNKIEFESEFKIGKYRVDFKINNIIIEANGLYWHSDQIIKNDKYHISKYEFLINKNYQPLFFNEDEIIKKFDICTSIILHKMNRSKKIYGRKCIIKNVNQETREKFCIENHLMSKGKGNAFGLYYNNELYGLLQFINKNKYIEISRFCYKKNTTIIGGFSKLLKHLEKEYPNKNIMTFIDRRYGSGKYLPSLGFKLESVSKSFKWTKWLSSIHRMKFPGDTGYQHGYSKIWDCGQAKYIKYNYDRTNKTKK